MKLINTHQTLFFLVFAAATMATLIAANANGDVVYSADLNDNQTPAGWTLNSTNLSGISNGRLEAYATNGSAVLSRPVSGAMSLTIEYGGSFINNFWGSYTETYISSLGLYFVHGVKQFDHGEKNFSRIATGDSAANGATLDSKIAAVDDSSYQYIINVTPGAVSFSGVNLTTLLEEFNLSYSDPTIDPSVATEIAMRAHHTVDVGVTWLDDISITLIPEPTTAAVLGVGLWGLANGRRRSGTE